MKLRDFWQQHAYASLALLGAIVLIALIGMKIAHAAGASTTLSWTYPVQYTDGTPLALSEIKEVLIQWRRPGNTLIEGSVHVAAPATSVVINGLACGRFAFTATTVVKTNNILSEETFPVFYVTGVTCPPMPPTNLTAT